MRRNPKAEELMYRTIKVNSTILKYEVGISYSDPTWDLKSEFGGSWTEKEAEILVDYFSDNNLGKWDSGEFGFEGSEVFVTNPKKISKWMDAVTKESFYADYNSDSYKRSSLVTAKDLMGRNEVEEELISKWFGADDRGRTSSLDFQEELNEEERFLDFIHGSSWNFESPFYNKKNVGFEESIALAEKVIVIWNQIILAETRVVKLDTEYDDAEYRSEEYLEKGQYGKYKAAQKRLDKLSVAFEKAEGKHLKLLNKYGIGGSDVPETLEDLASEMYLSSTFNSRMVLDWDEHLGSWDLEVDFDPDH